MLKINKIEIKKLLSVVN